LEAFSDYDLCNELAVFKQ
jgi:hypothetical protein